MIIMVLDPVRTHVNNSDCPSRLIQKPNGEWFCIDCGFPIVWTRIEVEERKDEKDE